MIGGLADVRKIPELKKRVLFTLAMLAVYRLGIFVSTPGIDVVALRHMFESQAGSLFGFINLFSGGALQHFSVFTLGVAPYISMSIIMQVLAPSIPTLAALKKEGEAGQRIITRYTRQGTILLALVQSNFIAAGLEAQGLVVQPGLGFRVLTMFTLTAGTAFIMWLGEQITERGIGNGTSIIIFAGIVARMPAEGYSLLVATQTGQVGAISVLFLIAFVLLSIMGIVFVERSFRRIPIQYPRRMMGKNVAQAQTQYMPLKINMSGVIPPIFASALMVVVSTVLAFNKSDAVQDVIAELHPGRPVYEIVFVVLVVVFAYFYTSIIFNPTEMADNLKKRGGFIPSVRPGKQTADYLYGVLNRLTLWGALYIAAVCVLPQLVYLQLGTPAFAHTFGGTAILIAVGVTLDTASQIESHIVARNYEAFMSRTSKMKSGIGSTGSLRSRLLKR